MTELNVAAQTDTVEHHVQLAVVLDASSDGRECSRGWHPAWPSNPQAALQA